VVAAVVTQGHYRHVAAVAAGVRVVAAVVWLVGAAVVVFNYFALAYYVVGVVFVFVYDVVFVNYIVLVLYNVLMFYDSL
jgi:hypothetical protein